MKYVTLFFLVAATLFPRSSRADDGPSGEQVFRSKCVACHGPQGEGTAKQKRRLAGDKSVAQLADLIAETMPEDDPGTLSAAEARAVAAYIHDAFYSRIARERNRPARIELARLTVRQYRLALADLVGSFREPARWGDVRGLKGDYSSGRRRRRRDSGAGVERVDPQIQFDFGDRAPVPEIEEPRAFTIRWNGSCLAPDTGEYEFVIRTDHAARLWVNDMDQPLIDASVKSGNDIEYRGSIFLLAGRIYPLKFEFAKGKQGVDDSDKQKEQPPSAKAFVELLWKRPDRGLEIIPARQLSPDAAPESFLCSTPFPPDDRSYGWERGAAVSKAWDEATTDAAIEAAGYVAGRAFQLAGTRDNAEDRVEKLKVFCCTFAERAFRRPLENDEAQSIVDRQFDAGADPEQAVRRVVLLVLKSPQFLYRELGEAPPGFAVAERLSFGLWNSIPDQQLREAAAAGKFATREEVAQEAQRMLADPRGKQKLREFLLVWLKADLPGDLAKDKARFPDFDEQIISDLRTSLELFLDDVLWSERSDFRRLFTSDEVYLNDRLAKFYGAEPQFAGEFRKVRLGDAPRSGVLTHPYLMARLAHQSESSPIHRGIFLVRGIMGRMLRPPPEAIAPLPVDLHPTLTTRERVALQTHDTACMACHGIINPLGFTLENFDAVGRFRLSDRQKPIDATGGYQTRGGDTVTVNGSRELAAFVSASEEAREAFVEQLFHHLVQQSVQAYGPGALAELTKSFAAHECNIRRLAIDVLAASALKGRER